MAEQGTLYFCAGDPSQIVRQFRQLGLSLEISGAMRSWRQIVVTAGEATLTLRLKMRRMDPAYFKRQLPHLIAAIEETSAQDTGRQKQFAQLVEQITGSIGLTAKPRFGANDGLTLALQVAVRAVDGFFATSAGFLDADGKPLLLNDGTCDPNARMPTSPSPLPPTADPESWPDDEAAAPEPRRVAERMFVMLAVGYRALIERDSPDRAQRKLRRLGEWFWALNVNEELEPHEQKVLDAEVGSLSSEQVDELSLSFEGIAVLAWALRLIELPAHDEPVDLRSLAGMAGLLSEDAKYVIDSADVRSPHELREAADHILAIHWRLNRYEQDSAPLDMRHMAAEAWFGHVDSGQLALIDNDLAIIGKPMCESTDFARSKCQQITLQRHRAINWLLGHHGVFSRVETST